MSIDGSSSSIASNNMFAQNNMYGSRRVGINDES